ncbi:MAG: universal stress protein [Flammeovirgaceae bacterium]
MSISKILVPTDFSEEANNATYVAAQLAKKFKNAEVVLLHVIDIPNVDGSGVRRDPISLTNEEIDETESPEFMSLYMRKLIQITKEKFAEVQSKYTGINFKPQIVFDSLARHLYDFVVKNETDLIVMGSKGASGMHELMVGSNTEKVIRHAKVPVLTVKSKPDGFKVENLVFASTFNDVPEGAAKSFKKIAGDLKAMVHFVKIITPNTFEITTDTLDNIHEFAKKYGFDDYRAHTFNHYSEEEGIQAFARQVDADMIALTTHNRKGLSHFFLGSIAEEVANHSSLPVLTFSKHIKQ